MRTVPADPSLWSEHDTINHHRRRYLREELIVHLESGGPRVQWTSHYNTLLYPAVAATRKVQRLLELGTGKSDLEPVQPIVNAVLQRLFSSEAAILGRRRLPFGVSLISVAAEG